MLTTQVKWHQKLTGSGCKTQWLCGNLHCGLSSVKVLVAQKALNLWIFGMKIKIQKIKVTILKNAVDYGLILCYLRKETLIEQIDVNL